MGVLTVEVRVTKPGRRPRWPEADLRAAGVEVFKRDQLYVMANG